MRIVKPEEMLTLPAGTIYSHGVSNGHYAEGLYRKGETGGDGWNSRELLPNRISHARLPGQPDGDVPVFLKGHWCPADCLEADEVFFVYEPADVAHLIESLTNPEP